MARKKTVGGHSESSRIARSESYVSQDLLRRDTALRELGMAVLENFRKTPDRYDDPAIVALVHKIEAINATLRVSIDVLNKRGSTF